jgi:hypothetical protein
MKPLGVTTVTMIEPPRRSIERLELSVDDGPDGVKRPCITVLCDCGNITQNVLDFEDKSPRPFEVEVALTCDGCMTTTWFIYRQGGEGA